MRNQAMDSIRINAYPTGVHHQSADCVAHSGKLPLEDLLRVSREWAERLPIDDPHRGNLLQVEKLAASILNDGNNSALAKSYLGAMWCVTCRRLDAVQGECLGQSLDRCILLDASIR